MSPKSLKRLGKLRDYAEKKPVAITADGKLVLLSEIKRGGSLSLGMGIGSLNALDASLQQKLTLARIKLDPRYDLGIFAVGKIAKDEVIAHVEQLTGLGKEVIQAEVSYCNEFMGAFANVPTPMPPLPKPKPPLKPVKPIKPIGRKLIVKNTVLFCEETTNNITNHCAVYRISHVHPVFATRGFNVVSLPDTNDTRANFMVQAKKPFVVYISGIGHGSPTVYTGYNDDHILEVGAYDPAEVKSKVIHLLSCLTAQQLGKDVVAKGARAYSGYFQNFTFVWDVQNTPINEEQLFYQCDSTFDISMANGCTVEQAYNATIACFNAAIATVPNTSAATWLTWDRNWFRSPVNDLAYGDKNATISPRTIIWIPMPFTLEELLQLT